MSQQMELFDDVVAKLMGVLEDPDKWDMDYPNPYNKICPECCCSIPPHFREAHVAYHRSLYQQMKAVMLAFEKLENVGKILSGEDIKEAYHGQ